MSRGRDIAAALLRAVAGVPELVARVPKVVARVPELVAGVPELVARVPEVLARTLRLPLLTLLLLLSAACTTDPDPETLPVPEPEPEPWTPPEDETPTVDPAELEGYERVPLSSRITHVQPMTGIVLWSDNDKRTKSYVQLEFAYMLYNEVCKEKDVFDWTPMDRLLERAAAAGHQVVVRFRYTYPGYSCAVPDYIKKWPGYEATNAKSEGRKTEFPDWRCEELRRFHLEFHRRFAERYDTDPRLAFLEVGFGLWAEYHIYDGPFVLGRTFPSKEFQAEFMRKMDGWFTHTPWLFSIDAADDTYGPFDDEPDLQQLRFGNFDDSFMCEDHDGYNFESWSYFGEERYKVAPLGGEFSYYSDYDQKHCLDRKGMHGRVFEDEVAKFHMTFIIGNDQPGKQSDARITEAAQSMGYRFHVLDYRVKPGVGAALLVENAGVAPIYCDAWMAVDGARGSYNLRHLMPGADPVWMLVPCPTVSASAAAPASPATAAVAAASTSAPYAVVASGVAASGVVASGVVASGVVASASTGASAATGAPAAASVPATAATSAVSIAASAASSAVSIACDKLVPGQTIEFVAAVE